MGNLASKLEAMLRGGGQGATAGWGDEGVAKILANLPMPDDGGVPREYGAGSAEQDYLNTERGANAESERRFPGSYHSGEALGATPAMMVGGASGGIAGAGLMGGLRGGVSGAGHAEDGSRLKGAATAAGPSAVLSMAGAAAPNALKNLMGSFPGGPPTSGLAPAYAGVGASVGQEAAQEGLPFLNMMSTTPAKRGPRVSGRGVSSPDEEIIAYDRNQWEKDNPLEAAREPNVGKPAIRPPAPVEPEAAYVPEIPKGGKTGVPSLKTGFKDLNAQEAEHANITKKYNEARQVNKELRADPSTQHLAPKQDMINMADPRNNPVSLHNDPVWRAMNEDMYQQDFPPIVRDDPRWIGKDLKMPKPDRLPDLAKETAAAEEHAALQEGIDEIKKRNKGRIQKTKVEETPLGPSVKRETVQVAPGKFSTSEDQEDIRSLMGTMPL